MTAAATITQDADAFAEHVFGATLHTMEMLAMYIGDRLGWYRALAEAPATPDELAARTEADPRYAREWLEQQAVVGWVDVVDEVDGERRYGLGPAATEVLTDETSLVYLAPLGRFLAAPYANVGALLEAYRSGGGVSWDQFGADAREGQAEMNRPWYERELPGALQSVDEIDEVLARPGARIADIGAGGGWSSIAIARAYRGATVTGVDVDEASVDLARANAAKAGLDDRVSFVHGDVAELPADDLDAVFFFECLHDMPHPVEALATARGLIGPDGVVVVMDEAVGEHFQAPGDDMERLMYGFSISLCLPDGMAHEHTAATGTVLRPATLERYAREAGFARVEVLGIEDFGLWRFYRLHP